MRKCRRTRLTGPKKRLCCWLIRVVEKRDETPSTRVYWGTLVLRRYSCDDDGVGRFTNQEARFISSEGEIQSFQFLLPLASRGPKVVWSFQLLVPVGLGPLKLVGIVGRWMGLEDRSEWFSRKL